VKLRSALKQENAKWQTPKSERDLSIGVVKKIGTMRLDAKDCVAHDEVVIHPRFKVSTLYRIV
jgi:hypothetical protein